MEKSPSVLPSHTIARHRKKIIFSLVAVIMFTVLFLNIKNFTEKREADSMQRITEYINKEMDRILLYKTRDKQNDEFRRLRPKLPLEPIRMTLTTAVFKYTSANPNVILKRVIWNPNNNLNEDVMSSKLRAPNIMRTLKTFRSSRTLPDGSVQNLLWIFAEFLDVKLSQKRIAGDEDIIRAITKDVLKGLEYMHKSNIAHLDLKIGNIMGKTTENGIVYKIIDFGYAQYVGEKGIIEIPKKNYGTYPYKPVEVVHHSLHGLPSDIWAVGAIVWFLSLGYTPFYLDDYEKDLSAYKKFLKDPNEGSGENHQFFFTKKASSKLIHFVKSCMNIDPHKRPTASELLNHPFITNEHAVFPKDPRDILLDDSDLPHSSS